MGRRITEQDLDIDAWNELGYGHFYGGHDIKEAVKADPNNPEVFEKFKEWDKQIRGEAEFLYYAADSPGQDKDLLRYQSKVLSDFADGMVNELKEDPATAHWFA